MTQSEDFLGKKKKKDALDLEKLSRYSVDTDRWDLQDFELILKNQPELSSARKKLADNIAGELGYDEGADAYWLLRKFNPELLEDHEVRPSRLLNKRVNEQIFDIPEFANVRRWTAGDPIAASQAFAKLEPDIEILYDKLKEQQKKQEQYNQAIADALAAAQDQLSAEEMVQQWLEAAGAPGGQGEEGEVDNEELERLQAQAEAAAEKAQDAKDEANDRLAELEASLDGMADEIYEALESGLEKANEYLETIQSMSQAWGTEPGELMRLPAKKRLELAKRLDTEKFRKMSKLIGPSIREAFAEQKRKVIYTPAEIVDLTLGNDIPRLIPSEISKFKKRQMRKLFMKDLLMRGLVQYEMTDTEKIARGGIIFIHDGSGSMAGDREIWTKAVGLAFLHVARKQKRSFYGIQFGSANQIRIDDFRDTRKLDPDKVIDFAEFFYGGGTDFQTPLKHAMDILKRENEEFGAIQSDIVFVTDGYCGITDQFMKDLKALQAKLQATIWAIAIGVGGKNELVQQEPLRTLADGKVATLTTLLNSTDIRDVFKGM